MNIKNIEKRKVTLLYTLLQVMTWSFYAVNMGFSSNVLYGFGYSDSQVSLLLTVATVGAFVVQLSTAELISRVPKVKVWGVLVVFGVMMGLSNLTMLLPGVPKTMAVAAFAVTCLLLQIIPPLSNAMGMEAIKRGSPTNYSFARGMGSLGYCVLAYGTGALVSRFGSTVVPVVSGICALAMVAAVILYHAIGERGLAEVVPAQVPVAEKKRGFLAQYPRFAIFLVAAIFLQMNQNLLCSFMYQIMLVKQGGAAEQGTANAICAFVEIPVMLLFPLMVRRLRCDLWVRLSSVFFVIKTLGIFMADAPGGVYLAQTTQMLGYGLYTISSVNYAEMVVAPGESVRAQSYLGSTCTVGVLLAVATGGVICDYMGAQTMILVAMVVGIIGCVTITLIAQKTKK